MCNIGKTDRILRAVVGVVIISWGVMTQNVWGAIGLIPLGTALISFCPFYPLLKINTGCKTKDEE